GSEENPITISSVGSGQGLVVMDTARESFLDHVVFDGLSNPATEGWELTGAVTFYKAPLKMTSCRFSKNRCEDALNVVSTHFELVGCKFDSIFSDALDSDFCKGKIMECVFTGCGNDAVDVSGSIIEAGDLFIDGVGDKGLSIGENSEMTALRISIKNAELAVTAKDSSKLVINRSKIEQCKIGLTAYRKKPEFNGASIFANHVTLNKVKIPWLLEKGSRALKNGKKLVADKTNVKDILYGKQYGKSSK
ncbi:MAG: hypothetical protein GY757_42670, partial [bacterium]|nr:hypothetical protein [bacterium]